MVPKLSIRGVSKVFVDGKREVEALHDVSFDVEENQFVSLLGTSGCGKSTLLSIVAGLEEQTAGEALVDGARIFGPGRDRGMVFQAYTLFPWMTVERNIVFALRGEGLDRRKRREVAREHLSMVGLESFLDAFPTQLSGGMRQRVAIARARCYRPKILLMDEPFGALDAQTRQVMQELLTRVWEKHRLTVLFVTHDIAEAVFLSDRVLLMSARPGRIKEELEIDLGRPRTFEQLESADFLEYRKRLLLAIREENLQAVMPAPAA
jgi:NitT/TauT family transport system ATP-binding protein